MVELPSSNNPSLAIEFASLQFYFVTSTLIFISEFPNLDFNQSKRRSDLSALAYNSYIGLTKLCIPLHGSVEKNTILVGFILY